MKKGKFNPRLLSTIKTVISHEIAASRKPILNELVKYINSKRASESEVHLNFICTHNSRRSQFCQIWAETASAYYNKKVYCFSGGLEITEFNINAVNTIKKSGFDVIKSGSKNPTYDLYYSDNRVNQYPFSLNYTMTLSIKQIHLLQLRLVQMQRKIAHLF